MICVEPKSDKMNWWDSLAGCSGELIPFLGGQPTGDQSHQQAVGCHYFLPCLL